MTDWNREELMREVVSQIKDEFMRREEIDIGFAELEIVENLYSNDPIEEIESKILELAWSIPSGALPVAAEAVINLLIEEAFKKNA